MTPEEEAQLIRTSKYNAYLIQALFQDYCNVIAIIMEDKKENVEKRVYDLADKLMNENIAGKN